MNHRLIENEKTNDELADLKTYFGLALGKTVAPTPPSRDLHALFKQQALEFEALKKQVLELSNAIANQTKDEWITSQEVLEIMPVCKRTLQNYRKDGVIPFKKIRGKIFYRKQDVIDFLESRN